MNRLIFTMIFLIGFAGTASAKWNDLTFASHIVPGQPADSFVHPADSVDAPDSLDLVLDSLIVYARNYLGTPYKYGGRGPERFDCSGYTSYVFHVAEISLPFSSRAQIHQGQPVDFDSVRKGDLVFFTSPRSGTNPGHVGIVTRNDSDGIYFIHSSSSRGVVEDRLEGHYRKKYLGARRIFD